jgi:hypothetical protein
MNPSAIVDTTISHIQLSNNSFTSNESITAFVETPKTSVTVETRDDLVYPVEEMDYPTLEIIYPITKLQIKGWELLQPIQITIEIQSDGSYLISDSIFNQYGEGKTLKQARHDFEKSLVEYYELLEAHITDEHPQTQALLNYLARYLKRW